MTDPYEAASDILGELPPARPDEPAALRRDIADELADHLACAVRREQVRGADYTLAYRRANERLGDIRNLARRLWWLAMKERIMTQRWMVAGQWSLVAAVVVTLAFFGYSQAAMQKTLAEQVVIHRHLISQSQQLLLTTGEATRERPVALRDPNLTVQLHPNQTLTDPPRPIRGDVTVQGRGISNQSIVGGAASDQAGLIDCGPLPAGPYDLQVTVHVPDGTATCRWFGSRTVRLEPGANHNEFAQLYQTESPCGLDINLPLPDAPRNWMRQQNLSLVIGFQQLPRQVNDWEWQSRDILTRVIRPDGSIETRWVQPPPTDQLTHRGAGEPAVGGWGQTTGTVWKSSLFGEPVRNSASETPLLTGSSYRLAWIGAGNEDGVQWLLINTTPGPDTTPDAESPLMMTWTRERPELMTLDLATDRKKTAIDLFRRTWTASPETTWDLTSLGTLAGAIVESAVRVDASAATTSPPTEPEAPATPVGTPAR